MNHLVMVRQYQETNDQKTYLTALVNISDSHIRTLRTLSVALSNTGEARHSVQFVAFFATDKDQIQDFMHVSEVCAMTQDMNVGEVIESANMAGKSFAEQGIEHKRMLMGVITDIYLNDSTQPYEIFSQKSLAILPAVL